MRLGSIDNVSRPSAPLRARAETQGTRAMTASQLWASQFLRWVPGLVRSP